MNSASIKNMRVGARLGLSFGGIILLILLMAGFNAYSSAKVQSMAAELTQAQAERLSLAQEWRFNVGLNAQRALAIGLSSAPAMATYFEADMKRVTARSGEIQKRYAEVETTPEGIRLQQKVAEQRKLYLAMRESLVKAGKSGDDTGSRKIASDFKPVVDQYLAAIGDLVRLEDARNQALGAEVSSTVSFMRDAGIAITGVCVLASILLGWLLTASIVRPLALAQSTADRITGGDLSVDLHATSHDEVGRLTDSLGKMQASLRTLVGGIRLSADSIGVASAEVATGNHDLSTRTEQAAASLQRTASSVEQLSTTVRQSADAARQADQLAQRASEVAGQGGEAVVSVVATMERIQESSRKIADIIGTIDSIAFQTNILALNAAVEAARAGEQGRGFAVVATEVRTLAQRSATAAKEIKSLIGESVDRVESGSKQAQAAGTTLADLVESVRRVSDIVGEISSASSEQAQGIGEINAAVADLDQATQQNAALVEESAAAASSLKEQAGTLALSIQRFRLVA